MEIARLPQSEPLLLLIAGAKGAVGSTVSVAVSAIQKDPKTVFPWMTTANMFDSLISLQEVYVAGWDISDKAIVDLIAQHGVIPNDIWKPYTDYLNQIHICEAPLPSLSLPAQMEQIRHDIQHFRSCYPKSRPVFVNLLPACCQIDLSRCESFSDLYDELDLAIFPDMAYIASAIFEGIPIVNFTSNTVEIPMIVDEAMKHGVAMSGRDGKTGQTYFKLVLASALKARNLLVDGWYSLNILGNQDGQNLGNPVTAAGKLTNKTELLDEILGYQVGERYGTPTHQVRIDYYPPRGDAKEAWDVIDILGIFGLPMSIRFNLLARDSILAAPLVIDLARWMAALQIAGRSGLVPELGFYYKKPVGSAPPLTFQEQIARLQGLERECNRAKPEMTDTP